MTAELIKMLRARRKCKDGVYRQPRKHEREAADRIEALTAENERLREVLELALETHDASYAWEDIARAALAGKAE